MSTPKERLYMSGREAVRRGALKLGKDSQITANDLRALGVDVSKLATDSALQGPAGANGFIQGYLLQHILPGVVQVSTQVRLIDEIAGVLSAGNWHDEYIAQRVVSPTGKAELYGDYTNVPLASYKNLLERRNVVRFEQGFQTGILEEARQAVEGYNENELKRYSVNESLEISRNRLGFFGFQATDSRTFGLLNDPSLPAYTAGTGSWLVGARANWTGVTTDFQTMFTNLELRSGGHIKDDMNLTVVLPLGYRKVLSYVNTASATSQTVKQWLLEMFPNMRFVFAPEFKGANGGQDVVYMFADEMADGDDTGGRTIVQVVPEKYRVLGSMQMTKGYIEDASNATAGIFVLRPWAFERFSLPNS